MRSLFGGYMNGRFARRFLSCALMTTVCLCSSVAEQNLNESNNVKVLVENVERVGLDKIHFRLKLLNLSKSPVFLEARTPIYVERRETGIFPEQLYLEQWTANGWQSIVPCFENAPSFVARLDSGRALIQERELTNPVNAPCKKRRVELWGRFRFRLDYFLSEKDARSNERNFNSSEIPLPNPHVAVSDPFEIPLLDK
jgi:hypothetical protein